MFTQARLKLTGWYLLIVMTISLAFSLVIYRSVTFELNRIRDAQRLRFERRLLLEPTSIPYFDEDILNETRGRVLTMLGIVNGSILILSAALGYYLAGVTLSPIQKMLEEQQQFISDASHELKTPLTAMRTNLEVGMRSPAVAHGEAQRILADNLGQVTRLQQLAEGLLEIAHSSHVQLQKTSVESLLTEAIRAVTPLATAKHVSIGRPGRRTELVMAEPAALGRALVAVLDNAIKYSPAGSRVQLMVQTGKRTLTIRVSDKGPGIANADLAHVTDRFYRSDKSRSTHGYGLGLPIAKQIMATHHGTLQLTSRLGRGTTVLLTLPYSGHIQQATG